VACPRAEPVAQSRDAGRARRIAEGGSNRMRYPRSVGTILPHYPLLVMSPAFYRREAIRYRLMAGTEPDRSRADQLRRRAAESDDLAEELEQQGWRQTMAPTPRSDMRV